MTPVTKPFRPPIGEYLELVESAFQRNWFTNDGPILRELEKRLNEYLGVRNGAVLGNGTISLQIAIKALGMKGKVLTTPFSYIATASSIAWEGCEPSFVDVDPNAFNVSAEAIANCIDEDVKGIVLTHCFGMPVDVIEVDKIARDAKIPIIYDAAHAFGTKVNGRSIFEFGDVSTCSFHATKLYHMVEGGAIFTGNSELFEKVKWMRNFGHNGPDRFAGVGINGKNSEIHAAMGLVNLRYADEILDRRRSQCVLYSESLLGLESIQLPNIQSSGWNCAYFPVLLEDESAALKVLKALNNIDVFPRRYFYPSLNRVNGWSSSCPNSESVSERVLCLPLYHDLEAVDQLKIVDSIWKCLAR